MTARRRSHVSVLASVLLVALAPGAGAEPADAPIRALQAQIGRLRRSPLGNAELVARLHAHLGVLDEARGAALGGRIGAAYRDSLLADAALLEGARSMLDRGDRAGALAAVGDVEADLAVKRRHVEASVGFSKGGLRTVTVTVRTLRRGKEEAGHLVWFVARGWSRNRAHYARFDELSSPTSAVLAPGNYLMWTGKATGPGRQPIVVGGHGRSRQTVDLPLP